MQKHNWRFNALGTQWEITTATQLDSSTKQAIAKHIELFETQLSRFRDDSLVTQLHQGRTRARFDDSFIPLFSLYEQLGSLTDGAMTPTIGSVLEAAGYDAQYSLHQPATALPAALPYDDVVTRRDAELTLSQPVMLDYGAAGKGLLVDQLCELLINDGHDAFVIDGSGDIRHVDTSERESETIGLEHPDDPTRVIGTVPLQNKALCASSTNRRAWGTWHHIINGRTALPTNKVVATWVIADSAMLADGLATALFFSSPEQLFTRYNYEYLRVLDDGTLECSYYFAKGVFS